MRLAGRDPHHIPERLTIYEVDRQADHARVRAQRARDAAPESSPAVLADGQRRRTISTAQIEVPDRWEQAHVESALGDQNLGGLGLDAGDRAQQLNYLGVRGQHKFDPLCHVLECGVERVDVREQLRDHDPVVLDLEAALESFAQLRDLRAHP